jgi:hypothetical protein
MTITVVGGGSSAHVLIPLLSSSGHTVNLLTRKPERWSRNVELQYQTFDGDVIRSFDGELNKISADPADVIPQSDAVILCMPVSAYRSTLHQLAPHINTDKEMAIGTVFGQGGFNWMVDEIKQGFTLKNITTFSFGLIPWICRVQEYGKIGITYGVKPINVAAVRPYEKFEALNSAIFEKVCLDWFDMGAFKQAESFLSLTLSLDNQIIHPSRCYGLYLKNPDGWDDRADVPFFYRDFDQFSANILIKLDTDYTKIRERIKEMYPHKDFPYMLDYITLDSVTNETDHTVLESFLSSKTLGAIETPVTKTEAGKWQIDTTHRFFTDDIHYGLCIAKWIADQLSLDVPMIDEIINWAQKMLGESLIDGSRLLLDSEDLSRKFKSGVPCYYGYNRIEDIVD